MDNRKNLTEGENMKKTGVIIAIVAVLAIAGGAFALTMNSDKKDSNTTSVNTSATTPAATENAPAANQDSAATTITYSDTGFSPSTLTVKSGTTITIKNESSRLLQVNSAPHPAHTDEDELNVGVVSLGKTKTFVVTKTGSHGYHNHLNDDDKGTLIVE